MRTPPTSRPAVERDEQVDVIRHPAGRDEDAAFGPEDATDVVVEARLNALRDERSASLGAEDQVIVKACE